MELTELLGSSKEVLSNRGAQLSVAEHMVLESLTMSSLQATSWLDHWVVTIFNPFTPTW